MVCLFICVSDEEVNELFEGDIVLTNEQKEANGILDSLSSSVYRRSASVSSTRVHGGKEVLNLWPNATVPYVFASTLSLGKAIITTDIVVHCLFGK